MRTIYIKLSYYVALLIVYGLYFDITLRGKLYKTIRVNLFQLWSRIDFRMLPWWFANWVNLDFTLWRWIQIVEAHLDSFLNCFQRWFSLQGAYLCLLLQNLFDHFLVMLLIEILLVVRARWFIILGWLRYFLRPFL